MMEGVSQILQPYKDTLGQVATIVTISQFFSGVFLCKDIHKKKSTCGIDATPFIGGVVVGVCMLKYALLLSDSAMLRVNVAAVFLNIVYTLFFHQYASNKWEEVFKPLSVGIGVVALFLGYAEMEHQDKVEYRYGLLVTLLMLLLLGAPLLNIKTILEKKDASSIPFPITFMGTIVSLLWFLYGIILLNNFMVVQNFIGFGLCVVQLALKFIYPAKEGTRGQSKNKKRAKKDL